ncbi:hypothetical protein CJ179_10560, partial [Rhodococcus sp. ACS1]|uniref:helix-turn-helix domain-containing protein n=1 Tax=Rhodococcus sp. ACS1 TaxID=2028570 RepID=UPI000BD14B33
EARLACGMTSADLARKMGVDRSIVTRFESGETNPTMATINRYAKAVGVMIRYQIDRVVVSEDDRLVEEFAARLHRDTGPIGFGPSSFMVISEHVLTSIADLAKEVHVVAGITDIADVRIPIKTSRHSWELAPR